MHRVQRHVQHAAALGAYHDRARAEHRPDRSQRLEIQPHIDHRRRQIARRRSRRRESLQLLSVARCRRPDRKSLPTSAGPSESSKIPGLAHVAADADEFQSRPLRPGPCALYQSTPLTRICGTFANVSTLFSAVGLFHTPWVTGNGGLLRGSARLPSIASISAVSSPQIYPPGLTKISRSNVRPEPRMLAPEKPSAVAALESLLRESVPAPRTRAGYKGCPSAPRSPGPR